MASAQDLPDTDWFVPELYNFARELGASVIRATHTRYVVDLNRPPDLTVPWRYDPQGEKYGEKNRRLRQAASASW